MIRTRTRTVAIEPIAIAIRLSGTDAGMFTPTSRRTTSSAAASPRNEHDLADRARVPADHRHRRAVPLARVPTRQRRHREQHAEEEREAAAEAGDVAGAGKPATPQT